MVVIHTDVREIPVSQLLSTLLRPKHLKGERVHSGFCAKKIHSIVAGSAWIELEACWLHCMTSRLHLLKVLKPSQTVQPVFKCVSLWGKLNIRSTATCAVSSLHESQQRWDFALALALDFSQNLISFICLLNLICKISGFQSEKFRS